MKKFLPALALLLASATASMAQNAARITGQAYKDSSYASGPIYLSSSQFYRFAQYGYMYDATELATQGLVAGQKIDTIAFYKTDGGTINSPWLFAVDVYMEEVAASTFSGGMSFANLTATSTKVADQLALDIPASGLLKMPLSTPFIYNGGNLQVAIDFSISGGTGQPATGEMRFRRYSVPSSIMGASNSTRPTGALSTTSVNVAVTNTRPETWFMSSLASSVKSKLARQFKVYPNPATSDLHIMNSAGARLSQATITDLSGRVLQTTPLSGQLRETIHVGSLPAGTYQLHLSTDQGVAVMTIARQ